MADHDAARRETTRLPTRGRMHGRLHSPAASRRDGRLLPVALAAVALLAACTSMTPGAEGEPGASAATVDTATIDTAPAAATTAPPVTEASVPASPAQAVYDGGYCQTQTMLYPRPRCGTVRVPAHWDTGEGALDVAVMVLRSPKPDPAADPTVYLGGGPGQHTIASVPGLMPLLDPIRSRGDVIVIDQRGMGFSQPALECPDASDAMRILENDYSPTDGEGVQSMRASLQRCGNQLRADGIDLSAYNTVDNAHDVEAVRVALGYPAWNIYGGSYGTRLALEVARQHPEGVRSLVLDSVFPPEADAVRDGAAIDASSLEAVLDGCRKEPACRRQGDLAERLRAVIATLDADPLAVAVADQTTGEADSVIVDGRMLVQVVLAMLTAPYLFVDLPELVSQLEQGHGAGLANILVQARLGEQVLSLGAFWAFTCNEEVAFADPAEVAAAIPADPFGRHDRFEDLPPNVGPEAFASCQAFGVTGRPDPVLNQPVDSAVPALVLAGRYDPRTPASWAESAAGHLTASHLVIDPLGGHGVVGRPCSLEMITTFLDDPAAKPDRSCFPTGQRLLFVEGFRAAAPELSTASYPAGDGVDLVVASRPVEWVPSDRGEAAWRQQTVLDPTVLVQDAGGPDLVASVSAFVSETFGAALGAPKAEERDGRSWEHRTASTTTAAIEWYQTTVRGRTLVVVLAASPGDISGLRRTVLDPALAAIDLTG